MSRIHILESDNNERYRLIIHTPVLVGTNSANQTWKEVFISAGLNVTRLVQGTEPGNLTQAELDSIIAGDTMELETIAPVESGGKADQEYRTSIDLIVDEFIKSETARLKGIYKFYGHIQEDI